MRLYRRSKDANWTLDLYHQHKRYVVSTRTINRAEANAFAREFIARLESGEGTARREQHVSFERLAELATTHYHVEGLRSSIEVPIARLARTFAGVRAADLTTERLEKYKADRLVENAKKATVNLELSALSLMFRLAIEQRLLTTKPLIRLFSVADNVRQGFVSQGDYLAIRACLPERLADLTDFLWWTGRRLSEPCQLQWRDVGERSIRIRAETVKTGQAHEVPLIAGIRETIERAASYRSLVCPYVFHRDADHPITRQWAYRAWKQAAVKAGLGHILIHDLRRSFVRNMRQAGVSEATIMKSTGHTTVGVFHRYNIITTDEQAQALERMSEYLNEQSTEPSVRKIR